MNLGLNTGVNSPLIRQGGGGGIANSDPNTHSLGLDLGDYLLYDPVFSAQTSFTVECWTRLRNDSGDRVILSFNDTVYLVYDESDAEFQFIVIDGSTFIRAYQSDVIFSPSAWYHLAAIYDLSQNQIRLYQNGSLGDVVSTIPGNNTGYYSGQMAIHAYIDGTNGYVGEVDELRIWNGIREPEDINKYMSTQIKPTAPGLQAYYRFNDDGNPLGTDLTGNGNNPTSLVGTPSFETVVPFS